MRTLYFLVPGTSGQFACGGLFAEFKTLKLAQQICSAAIVTYQKREPDTLFLDDVLQYPPLEDTIFVISWGFHIPKLLRRLRGLNVIYHAHSAGYGFKLPAEVPVWAVSRNTMGYWGQHLPNGLIYYLPNHISEEFSNRHEKRDIDVLVQTRKSSEYLLNQLVPNLQQHCNVILLDKYVQDLPGLFNRTKIYLYDSAEYWAQHRVTEGFGLPPLEAMACGCQVFASVNHALADYLDPGFNCHKIGCYSTAYDVGQIRQALEAPAPLGLSEEAIKNYRAHAIQARLAVILAEINLFFDHKQHHAGDIPGLSLTRLLQLSFKRIQKKMMSKKAVK